MYILRYIHQLKDIDQLSGEEAHRERIFAI